MQFGLIDSKNEKKKKKTRKNNEQTCDDPTEGFGTPTSLAKQLGSLATNMGGDIYICMYMKWQLEWKRAGERMVGGDEKG